VKVARAAVLAVACASVAGAQTANRTATYEVEAIRFATIPAFRVSGLIKGADTTRRVDIAMSVWLLRGGGRTVLVDAGFHRQRYIDRWKPAQYISPAEAVRQAGVSPDSVTDIIISHIHWDHADGIDLFPAANVWIQAEEYHYYVTPGTGAPKDRAIEAEVSAMLFDLEKRGKLKLVDGDAKEILPGVTVYTGGRHTYASQYVGVQTGAGTVVIASDNLYLYENLDKRAAIAQTFDAESNLRAQDRMKTIASDVRLIVPGHDPAVFDRFRSRANGVALIR
jgi:glyoxylase-like metal-dependent hydrolase (beta-lactamase superfamily II)